MSGTASFDYRTDWWFGLVSALTISGLVDLRGGAGVGQLIEGAGILR